MGWTTGPALADYLSAGINTLGALIDGKAKTSVHIWVKVSSFNTDPSDFNANEPFRINISDTPTGGMWLGFDQHLTPQVFVRAAGRSQAADTGQFASSAQDVQGWAGDGIWHPIGGVFDYGGDVIRLYLDGVLETNAPVTFGSGTYVNSVTTLFNDAVGGDGAAGGGSGTGGKTFLGDLAEPALWGDDIGDAGFAALASRIQARYVSPESLLWYVPGKDNEKDISGGGRNLVLVGSAARTNAHPKLFYPTGWRE